MNTIKTIEKMLEAIIDARSVISSINAGKQNALTKNGETVYWQREEWVRWALDEVLPVIEQAIAEAAKQEQGEPAPVQPMAFEEWHSANYVQTLEKYGDSYKNMHVRNRWQGWLGAKSTAPAAQPAVPEGWKLVPIEPTDEMIEEGLSKVDDLPDFYRVDAMAVYEAMLAAAPQGSDK